jgi:hypothetical protein
MSSLSDDRFLDGILFLTDLIYYDPVVLTASLASAGINPRAA